MIRLSKADQKKRDEIQAFLARQPFRYTAKLTKVPELTHEDVLNDYVPEPWGIAEMGQHFTPLPMALAAATKANEYLNDSPLKVFETSCGIGNLLHGWTKVRGERDQIYATELNQNVALVAGFLWGTRPNIKIENCDPFDQVDELRGKFDVVFHNPPYAPGPGSEGMKVISGGMASRREHLFLWLALEALKPGGIVFMIAPYNLVSGAPKKLEQYINAHCIVEPEQELPGAFRFTNVSVRLHTLRKL